MEINKSGKKEGISLDENYKYKICPSCKKGKLIPYGDKKKLGVDYYYKCEHCKKDIHFIPNVIVE